ncbi:baseplate J/gp47 family protein [Ruminiclostridium herbifermentans]|uniref:Baseplate J/gp47 family protein n=1 Tax=Ruminiclostridium herbifermentans TaxID=2488810 RepID=A0A7H1VKY0_9FIRM|nr:baseplate J/gp47 family protein [Ruminiclostridium herbifermentans]QNU66042.1 baseplate J/gp47 family protein [Ruminiclostridium herbifermentans]
MYPAIGGKDYTELIDKMIENFHYYTPEWRYTKQNPDAGSALFLIFAEMFKGNIDRFKKVPYKNYIAFLNMLGISTLPATAARAYITAKLLPGVTESVMIPAGTKFSANKAESEKVIFETERAFIVTPANIVDGYNVCAELDAISSVKQGLFMPDNDIPEKLFFTQDKLNLQQHILYIANDNMFNLSSSATIELYFKNSTSKYLEEDITRRLADSSNTEWMYKSEDEWKTFEYVKAIGKKLILHKENSVQIVEDEIQGIKNKWIRCSIKNINEVADIEIDAIEALAFMMGDKQGFEPDMVMCNDIELNKEGFYPFKEIFSVYDMFYISSKEILSKRGSQITLNFKLKFRENRVNEEVEKQINWKLIMEKSDFILPEPYRISITSVYWEYWNGRGWVKLSLNENQDELFQTDDRENNEVKEISISFNCPEDICETIVNNHTNYWIRARVVSIKNQYAPLSIYNSPWIEDLRLKFEFLTAVPVNSCVTYNNLEYEDNSFNILNDKSLFKPFRAFDTPADAFYLGFDAPPLKGPISIFFSINNKNFKELSALNWQYLGNNGWQSLDILDNTNNLTRTGIVMFTSSDDFAEQTIFGRSLYWIRILRESGNKMGFPEVECILTNTMEITQKETVVGELLECCDTFGREYKLKRCPVIQEEIWVNEINKLSAEEMDELLKKMPESIEVIKDYTGEINEFWVKWTSTDNLADSSPKDRHYVIDRASGKIQFGDGKNGAKPVQSGLHGVKVKYFVGGGEKGNVDANSISVSYHRIAFVEKVFNPKPSFGGHEAETNEEAINRWPQIIKHRNKAVTTGDFEYLAMEAARNIKKVRCLPCTNENSSAETGHITIAVYLGDLGEEAFIITKEQVESYIAKRCSATMALPGRIHVIEAVKLEYSIFAVVITNNMEMVVPIEIEAENKLKEFLDPLEGNIDNKGWEIGQFPHESVIYPLLKSIEGVSYVEKAVLSVSLVKDGKRRNIGLEELEHYTYGIVYSGEHNIEVKSVTR